jgi:hypothetical protein
MNLDDPPESEWCHALGGHLPSGDDGKPDAARSRREKSQFPREDYRTLQVHFSRLLPPIPMRISEGITKPRAVPHALERYREVRALSRNRGRTLCLPYSAY